MDGAALYAEAARHHFTPQTKRLSLTTPSALDAARTRLLKFIATKGASNDGDHNVDILPEGSLQNVRPEHLVAALNGLEAPAVIVVKTGDPTVEAVAVRLLGILRYCKHQLGEIESKDRRWRHIFVPNPEQVE